MAATAPATASASNRPQSAGRMADDGFVLPELTPINFSLTAGTSIPSPPPSPKLSGTRDTPSSPLDSPRPPTPGRGPLTSHPPSLDNINGAAASAASAEKPFTSSPPVLRLSTTGSHQSPPTPVSSRYPPQSPQFAKRPRSVLSFLNLRRFSTSTADPSQTEGTASPSPSTATGASHTPIVGAGTGIGMSGPATGAGAKRPMSPSLTSGVTDAVSPVDAKRPGLRKKKSASWFKRRMSGMPAGLGVEDTTTGRASGSAGSAAAAHAARMGAVSAPIPLTDEELKMRGRKQPLLLPGWERKVGVDGDFGGKEMFRGYDGLT